MRFIRDGARCVAAMVLAAASFASASVQASAVDTHIISDGTWRSSATGPAGWQSLGFDDSGWSHARAPYPTPSPGIPGSSAQAIWHDPDGTSDGNTGVTTAFFRYTFNLILSADSLPIIGQALISVDDDYAFYVNGTLALLNDDGGYAHLIQFVDFTSLLHNGENVFAIQAVDGAWGNPRDRIAERLLLDATIRSVPEPSSLHLLLAAVASIAVVRRRRS